MDGSHHPCKDAKQSMQTQAAVRCFFVVLMAYAGIKLWQKHAWSRVSSSRVDSTPAVGGCASRCGVHGGAVAQGSTCLRCNLHLDGIEARLRGVKPAMFIHFILACQQRDDCRKASRLLSVNRQLTVGIYTTGAGAGGGVA